MIYESLEAERFQEPSRTKAPFIRDLAGDQVISDRVALQRIPRIVRQEWRGDAVGVRSGWATDW